MDRKATLNAAEDALTKAELACRTIQSSLDAIDKEIGILTVVEGNLIANLNVLKNPNIIPLAALYAKTRSDLKTARNRRNLLRNDRETHLKAQKTAEKNLELARERYEKALKDLKNPGNVIQIDFGRQEDGQE